MLIRQSPPRARLTMLARSASAVAGGRAVALEKKIATCSISRIGSKWKALPGGLVDPSGLSGLGPWLCGALGAGWVPGFAARLGRAPGSAARLGWALGPAARLGWAPGFAARLGRAPGSAARLGWAPGPAARLGWAPGPAARLGWAPGPAARLGWALGPAARLGWAPGPAARLGRAPGPAARLGWAPGSAARLGRAPGSAARLGRAPGSAARLGRAPGSAARLGRAPGSAARLVVPFWAKDLNVGFANINAKAEGIENRPAFREAFQRRRCLVPVDGFYERKKTGTVKQPYAIALADRGLMARPACGRTGVRPRASGFEASPSSPSRRTSYALNFTTVCRSSSNLRLGRFGLAKSRRPV